MNTDEKLRKFEVKAFAHLVHQEELDLDEVEAIDEDDARAQVIEEINNQFPDNVDYDIEIREIDEDPEPEEGEPAEG